MRLDDIKPETLKTLCLAVEALDNKKVEDLSILYVGKVSSITDFFIIGNGNSEPHLRALVNELNVSLKDGGIHMIGRDAGIGSGWSAVDAFDVMIHLFIPEQRDFYQLDRLWKDAERVDPEIILAALSKES